MLDQPRLLGLAPHQRRLADARGAGLLGLRLPGDAVEPEAVGEALEAEEPAIHEGDSGDGSHQLLHHLGHDHLAAGRPGGDPGGGVDRLAVDVGGALEQHLAGVQPDAHSQRLGGVTAIVARELALDRDRAAHGAARRVEGEHEAVAEALELVPTVLGDGAPDDLLVDPQAESRDLVTPLGVELGRSLDVGEHDGDDAGRHRIGGRAQRFFPAPPRQTPGPAGYMAAESSGSCIASLAEQRTRRGSSASTTAARP